jgi:pimeloyl-ACP methyl ester carboxylesterase
MTLKPATLAATALARGERRDVLVGKVRTALWFYPSNQEKSKSIVLIHGYRGNHHGLEAIAGALSDFNLWIPDLPGFGSSEEFDGPHSIEAYAIWLKELISALDLKAPILLGHSFGTIVSAASLASGARAQAAVLVNPVSAPALKGPRALMTYLTIAVHWLTALVPERLGNYLLRSFAFVRVMSVFMAKTRNGALRRWIHRQHDTNFNNYSSRRVAIEGYRASISHHVGEYASSISQPTLLVAGEKDDITAVSQQEDVVAKFAHGNLVVLAGVGHLTHYETPDLVAEAVRDFVRRLPA